MDVSEAKRLKALEDKNAKLKKLLAESMLDAASLRELLVKKMVWPAARREAVARLRAVLDLSERRACTIVSADRTMIRYRSLRCAFHVIRPSVPRASGRAFHEHPATLVRGLRGFSSLLIASPAVKGVGGAEGCPREGPARPAPRRPGGWRCRARGRGRWASRGEGHAHCPASARLSAPVLRSDGPSRAMR